MMIRLDVDGPTRFQLRLPSGTEAQNKVQDDVQDETWSEHDSTSDSSNSPPASPIFSPTAPSSQSSVPSSSVSSSSGGWENDSYFPTRHVSPPQCSYPRQVCTSRIEHPIHLPNIMRPPIETALPQQRQHPRRTQPSVELSSGSGAPYPRPPPSLIRQSERKENFVDSLVDTTTQMIETIWPLSAKPCDRDMGDSKKENLIGLRIFVQEVLKRSKTSYSTLQVALYYLILIKSCIPKHDFTMEQQEDSQAARAMQCGRRMFLAALILASKYLQDRNFSARAWSKISGLRTQEINTNEIAFLLSVEWKLHIPETLFHRWTDIVLKYSPSASPQSPTSPISSGIWKYMIPCLTPSLDRFEFGISKVLDSAYSPPRIGLKPQLSWPDWLERDKDNTLPRIPQVLEPPPGSKTCRPRQPPLPCLEPLPTPQLTPQVANFGTPAVSAQGSCPRRNAMSAVMAQSQNACLARSTVDSWRTVPGYPRSDRRSSLNRSASSMSSPESMISDVSSRSSRSSSISSVTSSACALPPPRLAVQATRRCANLQLSCLPENKMSTSICPMESWVSQPADYSPCEYDVPVNTYAIPKSEPDYSKISHTFSSSCLPSSPPTSPPVEFSTQEAAQSLRDLALSSRILPLPRPAPHCGRKRERPVSTDLSLQENVRELITSHLLSDITKIEDDSIVLPDRKLADSFFMSKVSKSANDLNIMAGDRQCRKPKVEILEDSMNVVHANKGEKKPMLAKEGLPRKRACCAKEANRRFLREADVRGLVGPGMWEGVL